MASAEARARWLRNANRCFVEEDFEGALRSPSLPSSSTKSESEGSPEDGAKACDLLPDTKWWLPQTYPRDKAGSFWDPPSKIFPTHIEYEQGVRIQELDAVISETLQKKLMIEDLEEFWYADDHLVDSDPYKCLVSEKPDKLSSEMESHWIGVEKTEPWWRTADVVELSSFVSHKSLEHFENCDLPRPQRKHTQCFDQDKGLASLDQKVEKEMSNLNDSVLRTSTSVSMGKAQCTQGTVGCSPCGSDKPFRNNGCSITKADEAKDLRAPNSDLSKAQLLEALCHSQTRAREAEKAAQQAYNEKEHVVKLFFRQASQLFAYKQWLQILQLEALCLRIRNNKDQPIFTRFPAFLPWVPSKGRQPTKGQRKAARRKPCPPRYRISKYFRVFLMGLSLAGAGLLLGWTMGWLFPAL